MSQEVVKRLMDAVGNGEVPVFGLIKDRDGSKSYWSVTSIYTDRQGDVIMELEIE